MAAALRKRESPFLPPFRMMDEDEALGPKGWGSMECEAAWRQRGRAEKKKQPREKLLKNESNLIVSLENHIFV